MGEGGSLPSDLKRFRQFRKWLCVLNSEVPTSDDGHGGSADKYLFVFLTEYSNIVWNYNVTYYSLSHTVSFL